MIEPRIITHLVYPPIPLRHFNWNAVFEGYEPGDLIGYGATEKAAVLDLREQAECEREVAP